MISVGPEGLLSQVTPLTKGLLWLTEEPLSIEKSYYKQIDYLLNGLLTATLKASDSQKSHVLIAENFGHAFYVFVGTQISEPELKSFFDLVKVEMKSEQSLLLIDELKSTAKIQKLAPNEVRSKILFIS